jgi:ATP-binding protein involved in chromosome partitioning
MIPILVTSGKGGVGKSTVSANLAIALIDRGLKVSLLDADLMDPVMHTLFKVDKESIREYGKMLTPIRVRLDNVELEFMGLGPFIPRGVGVALSYEKTADFIVTLLKFVKWSGDYIIIDCPPGAIDVNVKLLKELKGRARAVLVGEPHMFAFEDNLRMLDLLRMYDIDVRAIVLNKYNMFIDDVAKAIENEYNKLNLKVIKIPWVEELQVTFKPELFKELAEVIVV